MNTFAIIQQNQNLIATMVRKSVFGISPHDKEDLVADISLALVDRLKDYDPNRGVAISSFIGLVARNLVIDWSRKQKHRRAVSLDTAQDEGEPIDVQDMTETPEEALITAQERARLRAVLDTLTGEWKGFAAALISEDFDPETYAATHGVKVATVYSRKNKLIARLAALR